eukprot:747259-Hanusia_phi.AAC.2
MSGLKFGPEHFLHVLHQVPAQDYMHASSFIHPGERLCRSHFVYRGLRSHSSEREGEREGWRDGGDTESVEASLTTCSSPPMLDMSRLQLAPPPPRPMGASRRDGQDF